MKKTLNLLWEVRQLLDEQDMSWYEAFQWLRDHLELSRQDVERDDARSLGADPDLY